MVMPRLAILAMQSNVSVRPRTAKVMLVETLAIRFMTTYARRAMATGTLGQYHMIPNLQVLDVWP